MKKSLLIVILVTVLIAIAAACSSKRSNVSNGTAIKTVTVDSLTATLSSGTGQLKQGDQEVTLAFTDSSGKPVDVGAVSLNFHMPAMGGMAAMNDAVTFTTTNTPGVYRGKVNIGMAGEWQAQLAYEGTAGKGKTTFSVTAR
ncbi:MAG TPA: FixH family protein [Pyrinomonadaceae bacterium]|nr:FixH family protein [Pyrinomonadaceae bacterium]